jgi:hypothetical protein
MTLSEGDGGELSEPLSRFVGFTPCCEEQTEVVRGNDIAAVGGLAEPPFRLGLLSTGRGPWPYFFFFFFFGFGTHLFFLLRTLPFLHLGFDLPGCGCDAGGCDAGGDAVVAAFQLNDGDRQALGDVTVRCKLPWACCAPWLKAPLKVDSDPKGAPSLYSNS